MDPVKARAAVTPRTKAIVPVHLYGQMVDMGPLLALASEYELKVVEDCAQAHGARQNGRQAGTLGNAAAFSFYPGKNLGAYGDAGAVVSTDPGLCAWIRQQRDHGRMTKYEHEFEGQSSRLDGLQAAILRAKLPHLAAWTQARRRAAARYNGMLAGVAGARPVAVKPGNEPVYHLYVVRLADEATRNRCLAYLKERGIGAGVHYPVPLHRQPAYAYLGYAAGDLPVTEHAARTILSLPIYPEIEENDQRAVVQALAEVLGREG
jgi:dTDP-4-amino-4,6-dideoxygalactose transaminase